MNFDLSTTVVPVAINLLSSAAIFFWAQRRMSTLEASVVELTGKCQAMEEIIDRQSKLLVQHEHVFRAVIDPGTLEHIRLASAAGQGLQQNNHTSRGPPQPTQPPQTSQPLVQTSQPPQPTQQMSQPTQTSQPPQPPQTSQPQTSTQQPTYAPVAQPTQPVQPTQPHAPQPTQPSVSAPTPQTKEVVDLESQLDAILSEELTPIKSVDTEVELIFDRTPRKKGNAPRGNAPGNALKKKGLKKTKKA